MASIYYLNHPSNSFWDNLTTGLDEHPFFSAGGQHPHPRVHSHHHRGPAPFWGWGGPAHPVHQHRYPHSSSFGGRGGPSQRDHDHPFPSSFWGWGDSARNDGSSTPQASRTPGQTREATPGPSGESSKNPEKEPSQPSETETEDQTRYHCGKGKHTAHGDHGLGKRPCNKNRHGPGPHHHRGFHNGDSAGAGPYKFPFGGWDTHDRSHGSHRGPQPFAPNLDFLRNLAGQFGVHFHTPTPEGVDFVPVVDVFDTPDKYIVHVSLPGAKKDDLSIDYDIEESVLRLAGVVYRPGINEDLHQALAMEERAREVGVFEREVRFGTRETPAVVAVDGIMAKLEDGILNVTLPKVTPEPQAKKKVFVRGDVGQDIDEKDGVIMTPDESEESDGEEEARDYVKVPVQ